MIAVQYRKSIPRYLAIRGLQSRVHSMATGPLALVSLVDLPEPALPKPTWVRVSPTLSGICGSDLATVCAKGSPYLSPLTSTPFVLGHELVGRITEVGKQVDGLTIGQRMTIQPALGCTVRGIAPPCQACASGQLALCRNVTRGDISAGIQTGYCRDTGGAWSRSLVAHASQVYTVPDTLDDEVAVLIEPFACALHAVCQAGLQDPDRHGSASPAVVLIMGCGTMGLLTLAAIRAVGYRGRVVAVAKYEHQRAHALQLGATDVLPFHRQIKPRFAALAAALEAELHQPEIGKPTVSGGADVTFDCVASSNTIDDCCRFTAAGGTMVLVGMPAIPAGIDWTTIWYKELSVQAAYAYGVEHYRGQQRSTFDLATALLVECNATLRPLVSAPFAVEQYRQALQHALHAGSTTSVKTVFRL